MDQYINIFGKSGHVLQIDCRTLESKYFPFDYKNISIVLFDTNVSHSLATTEYNQRRKECSEGTEVIKKGHPEVSSLRDVSIDMIHEYSSKLNDRIYRRCKYVVEENERLLRACDSLTNHDLKSFGKLMYKTHEGLTKDYEVSCKELDFLVDLIRDEPGVYGSRMMGGGFGGCTINLIENDFIEPAGKKVKEEYKKMFGIEAKIYITKINSGTSIIKTEEDDRV
jgi:galactokinase